LNRALPLAGALLFAVGVSAPGSICFAQHKRASKAPKEDAFLTGPPFSLDEIIQRVGVIADRRLSEAINRRGVSFTPGKADLEKLKAAGAAPEILQAVSAKAPPPTPKQPPRPALAGAVRLECHPAECDISINDQAKGQTQQGIMSISGLPAGSIFIDFKKDGYIGQQITANLRAGADFATSITLEPTAATEQALGRQLFLAMVARLGGPDAIRRTSLVEASGSAILFSGGQRTDWNAVAKVKLPLLAQVEITGAGLKWRTSVKAGDSKFDGTGKLKGSQIAMDMEKLVRLYRDYQLDTLTRRMNMMHVSSTSVTPDETGHVTMLASSDTEKYKVTLRPDGTPISVVYSTASGLGSGLEVVYSDYATIDKAWYPKTMAIRLGDQTQHGLELRFTEVRFPNSLADREFHF